ncbi:MAG TPA: hypothetical protein VFJ16_30940 [Longimicrobium sp.]|nr:hypothetical protein [Longimicrobium sp.]
MSTSYQAPLERLRKLGAEPARRRTWPDYRHLGLTERHVPGLIQIATDPELHAEGRMDRESWAPVHAWRALAQLGATTAVTPLLALLERQHANLWVYDEVPAPRCSCSTRRSPRRCGPRPGGRWPTWRSSTPRGATRWWPS